MRNLVTKMLVAAAVSAAPMLLNAQAFVSAAAAADGGHAPTANVKDPAKKPDKALLPPSISAHIRDGVLSVDGMVAKVHLDYDIDAPYMYFYIPGAGTMVVSVFQTPGSTEMKDAFWGSVLQVHTNGHDIRLDSKDQLLSKKRVTAYVRLDTAPGAMAMGNFPVMGFGPQQASPYAWPGALPLSPEETAIAARREDGVKPPPLPQYMLPTRVSIATSAVPPQTDPAEAKPVPNPAGTR